MNKPRRVAPLYLLHPGPVADKGGDGWHHVRASSLARCYGVPMSACIVAGSPADIGRDRRHPLIDLRPLSSGDYRIPSPDAPDLDSYAYLRRAYGVTFRAGDRARHTLTGATGSLVEHGTAPAHYLRVAQDGGDILRNWHPAEAVAI
jgi:hypothetical protein